MAQNIIGIFDSSCPSGWVRVSAWDDKFVMGKSSYGTTGGAATHTHTFKAAATTSGVEPGTHRVNQPLTNLTGIDWNHTHSVAAQSGLVSTAVANWPAYIDVLFCSYNEDFSVPAYNYSSGDIYFFDAACPSGWTQVAALDDVFLYGASSYGSTGGGTHTHGFNPANKLSGGEIVGVASLALVTGAGNTVLSVVGGVGHKHQFDRPYKPSSTENEVPPWIGVIICKKN